MGKIFKGFVATLAIGSALAVTAPADARGWHGDHGWHGGRGWHGDRGWHHGWRGARWGYGGRYYDGYYDGPRYGWGYYGRPHYYYHDHDGDALIAGIAGLAIGAAIASH